MKRFKSTPANDLLPISLPKRKLTKEQNDLVQNHFWLAESMVKRFLGYRIEEEELRQWAYFGLIHAAMKFKQGNCKFSTYAGFWVNCYLYTAIRHLWSDVLDKRTSAATGFWSKDRQRNEKDLSLNLKAFHDESDPVTLMDLLVSEENSPEEKTNEILRKDMLEKAMAKLNNNERGVIKCIYWRGLDQAETGRQINRCRERVRQIRIRAIHKMKTSMSEQTNESDNAI